VVDRTGTALIKVTSGGLAATSLPFQLANGGTLFYVNDASTLGDQYTTAVGNDANTGKSPDQPMASLAALLRAYPIGAGDTIYVDTGNYVASSNAVLTANDSGTAGDPVMIIGPTNGGTVSINRGNATGTSPGSDAAVITVNGASYDTIENLTLTGAYDGVDIGGISNGITLENDIVYGNAYYGVYILSTGTVNGVTIADSTIRNNASGGIYFDSGLITGTALNDQIFNNGSAGIQAYSYHGEPTIMGGAVYGNAGAGIVLSYQGEVSGVLVHGNTLDGIDASSFNAPSTVIGNTVYANGRTGINGPGDVISGNIVYNQSNTSYDQINAGSSSTVTGNTIYGGSTGLEISSSARAIGNLVYDNAGTGIYLDNYNNETVTGNVVYGNAIGIDLQGTTVAATDNVVYSNVTTGIEITAGTSIAVVDNTIYTTVGQALTVSGASHVTVENNILWVDQGTIINIAASGATGFLSAYNLFYQGANATPATLGLWQGAAEATLAAWQTASGQDSAGSKTGNPGFVNIKGADQVLGGPGTAVGVGADDDFELSANSPAIDAGNANVTPSTDLLNQPRHDDPATANTGTGAYLLLTSSANAAPTGGTALNLNSYGNTTTYTLPFGFTLYGTTYTSVGISTVGYLQFAGPNATSGNGPTLAEFVNNVRIAPFWAAINTAAQSASGANVYVSTTATSVTFRWQANANTGGGAVNFSVTLNNDGSIVFAYGSGNAGLNPIIGVSAGNGLAYILSPLSGSGALGGAATQTFTPGLGADIGAIEFQGSSADTAAPTVTAITLPPTNAALPSNSAATSLAFNSIVVTFSKPLDYVSANSPQNYSLIEADSNGLFNTAAAITIPVTPQYTLGSSTVTLLLPSGVLVNGKYQLTLSGSRAIFDVSGNKLAGNGTTAGTDDVIVFKIDRSADQPPVAIAQPVSVNEGDAVQIVLAATDAAGLPLTYTIVVPPGDGALSAITNGHTLTYTPAAGFFGADAFTFQATDPDGAESQAVVSLTVTAVNQAPVAAGQSVSIVHGQSQVIVLGGSDAETLGSQLTYTITTAPAHGTLTPITGSPGAFTYTPTVANYIGADSFAFTVTDTGNPPGTVSNASTSGPATVSITLVDPAPVGVPVSYTTRARVPLNVPAAQGVLVSDLDAAGDTLTATLHTTTAHGTLVLNANGSFLYTPATGFTGTDTFSYIPVGALTSGAPVTVTITVTAGIAPPTAPSLPTPHALAAVPVAGSRPPLTRHASAGHGATRATRHLPPKQEPPAAPSADALTDAMDLLGVADPILLPSFTLPPFTLAPFTLAGDEVARLMLPATPEIATLQQAVARAMTRWTARTPSHITFIDPVTGQADDDGAHANHPGGEPWLLVDTNRATGPSRITWDTPPA
jgi:VCBS repeat-containing protein